MSFDIAIIGGSITGLSVAREISHRCDANIVIIEEHDQIGKPANSSAFTFTDTVQKYGLDRAVVRYYTKFNWYSFLGSKATFQLNGPELTVLNSTKICHEILAKSKKANLEICTGTQAVSLNRKGGKFFVQVSGEKQNTIECDLLIDASGTSFLSSKYFSYRIPQMYSNPYGYELDNCDIPETFLDTVSFFSGMSIGTGGGWFYPITKSVCTFGVAEITRTPTFPKDKLEKRYDFAREHLQPFAQMIKDATPRCIKAGKIPAEPMKKLVSDNIMRVGDAAGHATPHINEGVRPCIEAATLCGKVAAEAYEKNDFSKSFLKKFERIWQSQNKLSYLYLMTLMKLGSSRTDKELEEMVKGLARREKDPEGFLQGLKGKFKFPISLFSLKPDIAYLKNMLNFACYNVKWLVE